MHIAKLAKAWEVWYNIGRNTKIPCNADHEPGTLVGCPPQGRQPQALLNIL